MRPRSSSSSRAARRRSRTPTASTRWYSDFLEFQASEGIFATLLTPGARRRRRSRAALGHRSGSAQFNEITGLLRARLLVHVAGLDPRARADLAERERGAPARGPRGCSTTGAIFAFGLSEREHGADIYSTDMVLTPDGEGGFRRAAASTTSATATRRGWSPSSAASTDIEGPEGYVFFAADSQHPNYELIRNVVNSQNYVSQFELRRLPGDGRGRPPHRAGRLRRRAQHGQHRQVQPRLRVDRDLRARAATRRSPTPTTRVLYGMQVTDFPHVRQAFTDAYARLVAMKLFAERAIDYMRSRQPRRPPLPALQPDHEDEGDDRGRAGDRPALGRDRGEGLREATCTSRWRRATSAALPKLEGTVHVNMALVLKFMADYLFNPARVSTPVPSAPRRRPTTSSSSARARRAGSARSASTTGATAYDAVRASVPNVARFVEQAEAFERLLDDAAAGRGPAQGPRLPARRSASCSR